MMMILNIWKFHRREIEELHSVQKVKKIMTTIIRNEGDCLTDYQRNLEEQVTTHSLNNYLRQVINITLIIVRSSNGLRS